METTDGCEIKQALPCPIQPTFQRIKRLLTWTSMSKIFHDLGFGTGLHNVQDMH